jgi:hypothetical protein
MEAVSSRPGTCPSYPFLLALGLLLSHGATAQVSWVLPWNDAVPSVTDLSNYNTPITTNRVTVDTNGHFVVAGERIRFLGVNFAGDSPFMPTNNADGVARRLAKFGINNVRFHHMDASWAYNGGLLSYSTTSSTNIRSSSLERLHYLVTRLKAHGIYANINLLVGREYRSGDGLGTEVTGMDWKDAHILGYFYPPALALHKDYALKLLTATNRFSGLTLAQDPAVAFVEIINENGIIQKWYDGGLDRLPARYATNLQARWNDWLAARYNNSEPALLSAWNVINQPLGTNLLRNGSFTNSLNPWNKEQHGAARASFLNTLEFTNGGPCARIDVTNAEATSWYIQFNQSGLQLSSNQAYTVTYWARCSTATNIEANVMRAHTDWINLGYIRNLDLTTSWQMFTNTFQPTLSETNARMGFSGMGNKLATFYFADVRLQAGGQLGNPPPGTSLAARNLPIIARSGAGYTGTKEARRDWLRFLRDLENLYYDDMVAHVRTKCGYPGLIFGTIMANSPATVQSRLDVIDGHSYWQHPNFPGQPWDSVNWTVDNISMVNTLDNTLTGLGRQRIKGKPLTVTEYQHPSPNYYGAEGPLMLAAYGGLQDWDGLWLFDYGHGNPVSGVTMGYVRGFFEIGQHPTKLSNLPIAANLFRRGDVARAQLEHSMMLTSDRELELLLNAGAWNVFSSGQLGMPGKRVLVNRVSTTVGSTGLTTAPADIVGNDVFSDTGQLRWNLTQAGQGLLTYNTRRTKGLVGYADNKAVTLDAITFQPGTTKLGWCTLGLTLRRGEVVTNDCTALIIASGWWENTGQVWKDATKNSVGNQWGTAPVLAEVVPFSITLPVATNHVRVWSLNELGQRKAQLPVTGSATNSVITVDTNAASLWYELEVGRWMTSFNQWRWANFDETELAAASLSGVAGTPAGDGVPNLIKYHLGSPALAAVPPQRLPRGSLREIAGLSYLAITYERDALADDVAVVAEVSTDLQSWSSGTALTVTEPVVDLGAFERVTIRTAAPVTSSPFRYMRLRFDRLGAS